MKLVDSHCHLNLLELDEHPGGLGSVIEEAAQLGVCHMLCVSTSMESLDDLLELRTNYEQISISVGVHPNQQVECEPSVSTLVQAASRAPAVAIGETGLDYYRSQGDTDWQRQRFRTHIQAAKQTGLPIIVHSRSAKEDTVRILEEEGADEVGGVMHCFVEDWPTAEKAMALNFLISFSGIVTFKNAGDLKEVAAKVPTERLLIETDSPYLAPTPYRGKPNQPGYVRYVAESLAKLRNTSLEEIAEATTRNFFAMFPKAKLNSQ